MTRTDYIDSTKKKIHSIKGLKDYLQNNTLLTGMNSMFSLPEGIDEQIAKTNSTDGKMKLFFFIPWKKGEDVEFILERIEFDLATGKKVPNSR